MFNQRMKYYIIRLELIGDGMQAPLNAVLDGYKKSGGTSNMSSSTFWLHVNITNQCNP